MIPGLRLLDGRLAVEPTASTDTQACVWARTPARAHAVALWLNPAELRELGADLIERADLIDPPPTREGT